MFVGREGAGWDVVSWYVYPSNWERVIPLNRSWGLVRWLTQAPPSCGSPKKKIPKFKTSLKLSPLCTVSSGTLKYSFFYLIIVGISRYGRYLVMNTSLWQARNFEVLCKLKSDITTWIHLTQLSSVTQSSLFIGKFISTVWIDQLLFHFTYYFVFLQSPETARGIDMELMCMDVWIQYTCGTAVEFYTVHFNNCYFSNNGLMIIHWYLLPV